MRKILIIGVKGMLGQELVRVFSADKNHEVFAWDQEEIDITDEAQVKEKIGGLKPEIIINAAAYNAVDKAEEPAEFEKVKLLNGLAPGWLAEIAKEIPTNSPFCKRGVRGDLNPPQPSFKKEGENAKGAIFVHYSTDYVFDGAKREGYKENDEPSPINNYGISKLMGEQAVQDIGGKFYLIRLQKLFGQSAKSVGAKKSFFEMMLALAEIKKEIEVIDEELANFTYAPDLAERTKYIIEQGLPFGIYHVTNEGAPVTWFDAAKILFDMAGRNDVKLIPVSAERFPRPAPRPKFSILVNTKLPPLRPWPEALKEFLKSSL